MFYLVSTLGAAQLGPPHSGARWPRAGGSCGDSDSAWARAARTGPTRGPSEQAPGCQAPPGGSAGFNPAAGELGQAGPSLYTSPASDVPARPTCSDEALRDGLRHAARAHEAHAPGGRFRSRHRRHRADPVPRPRPVPPMGCAVPPLPRHWLSGPHAPPPPVGLCALRLVEQWVPPPLCSLVGEFGVRHPAGGRRRDAARGRRAWSPGPAGERPRARRLRAGECRAGPGFPQGGWRSAIRRRRVGTGSPPGLSRRTVPWDVPGGAPRGDAAEPEAAVRWSLAAGVRRALTRAGAGGESEAEDLRWQLERLFAAPRPRSLDAAPAECLRPALGGMSATQQRQSPGRPHRRALAGEPAPLVNTGHYLLASCRVCPGLCSVLASFPSSPGGPSSSWGATPP